MARSALVVGICREAACLVALLALPSGFEEGVLVASDAFARAVVPSSVAAARAAVTCRSSAEEGATFAAITGI